MEIGVSDIFGFLTNPYGTLIGLGSGFLMYKIWILFKSIFNPVSYVDKLYSLADKVIENLDNQIIDKIRNKKVKEDIHKELSLLLRDRSKKINELIKRISD
jgi:hypothetical protein